MKRYLVYSGNVEDVKTALKNSFLTVDEIKAELEEERSGRNRSTVIYMLTTKLRRLEKEVSNG